MDRDRATLLASQQDLGISLVANGSVILEFTKQLRLSISSGPRTFLNLP